MASIKLYVVNYITFEFALNLIRARKQTVFKAKTRFYPKDPLGQPTVCQCNIMLLECHRVIGCYCLSIYCEAVKNLKSCSFAGKHVNELLAKDDSALMEI